MIGAKKGKKNLPEQQCELLVMGRFRYVCGGEMGWPRKASLPHPNLSGKRR